MQSPQARSEVLQLLSSSSPRALWFSDSGVAEILPAEHGEGVSVKALFSGISRGTERVVFRGEVPVSEYQRMRCFGQQGDFSFPIKYGYSTVGEVMEGELAGSHVFVLHPHQDFFRAPEQRLHVLPKGIPPERAVLAANMETALNITWDSEASVGDRVAVIGAGVVGALTAYLLASSGVGVVLVDTNPKKGDLASKLGLAFAMPEEVSAGNDVVINTSASSDGLISALKLAADESVVVEASWFGDQLVALPLGQDFHSRRLTIKSSQVGKISPSKSGEFDHRGRMNKALELLKDPKLDSLISGQTSFESIDREYEQIIEDPETLCHRIHY